MPWGKRGCGAGGSPASPGGHGSPVGAAGRGAASARGAEVVQPSWAGERGLGTAGPLVKALCNSCLCSHPVSILCPVAKSPTGAGMGRPAPAGASASFGLLLAGLLARLFMLGEPCGGRALPALAAVAPGLPRSAPIIQARRMRPSSSSVCVSSRSLALNCISKLAPVCSSV